MTPSDRTAQETRYVEESLRRQLRWIEDDIVITLLGPDAPSEAAKDDRELLPGAPSSTKNPTGKIGLLSRLRQWSTGVLRRAMAIFE